MKIVIDIPEEIIKDAKDSPNYYPTYHFKEIWRAITNGTPLPKGHGKLIDSNILKGHIDKLPALPDGNFAGNHSALKALINMQPTIIPTESED